MTFNQINYIMLIMLIASINCKPLSKNFNCPEVNNEIFFFRNYISNSTNIDNYFDNILSYFNVSTIYKTPIIENLEKSCKFKKLKKL